MFVVVVTFSACIQKTRPVSGGDATATKEVGYIAIGDSSNARPILEPSYDEIIAFMADHKIDVKTHFIINRKG